MLLRTQDRACASRISRANYINLRTCSVNRDHVFLSFFIILLPPPYIRTPTSPTGAVFQYRYNFYPYFQVKMEHFTPKMESQTLFFRKLASPLAFNSPFSIFSSRDKTDFKIVYRCYCQYCV